MAKPKQNTGDQGGSDDMIHDGNNQPPKIDTEAPVVAAEKRFSVSLKYVRALEVKAANQEEAVEKYKAAMGILRSEHQFVVQEVTEDAGA